MLSALMDGRAWTGRELAACAYVTAPTASAHLQRLVHGGLISVFAQGRRRYYRIASHQVASALESLLLLAPASMPRHITQRRIAADLAAARLCYDHLAGKLGVALADALVAMGALAFVGSTASLTSDGIALLQRLGIAIASESSRKALCRPCIDWSERRPHIAGMVGGALASLALDRNWIVRKADSRAVTVTAAGIDAFRTLFQFECDLPRRTQI